MATRRTQLPNVRPKGALPRSRVAAQPSRSATTNDIEQHEPPLSISGRSTPPSTFPPLSLASPTKRNGRLGDLREEMNVQVVVRSRVRSEREVHENSPIIVATQGACSEEVTIETASPTSNLGIYTSAPTRTYPFDRVFGPEADQAMVYNDVVQPVLEEVLAGYNCTVFAYGQTGTGKTYTMQGDLTPSVTGGPCADAGMIPRVLSKLYQHLETSVADYIVKISYVELYNEELRDLLAADMSAPAGSAQPMGLAGPGPNTGLKIFDEAGTGKKGVLIQGLEEVSVKDFNQAIGLLRKGSHRRQIAATKFNEHSSRSHSIFTVTVHTKETSAKGDDTLRVGKLNLVDLAGSENIGRSGAENKRAREAGMINQSLLTLGRVINALVDQSSHVPYRESKLTRLLQDSLGGRTKTCIIATISPARSNMEETLSTLDYALRAKSIRNKPEVNQRMTRNSLLKEYVVEIDKLKSDLLAAREKNGIWFSKESWQEMSEEQEQMKTLHEESKRQVEIIGSQMRAVREEFEQGMALLMKSEGELKETKEKLVTTEGSLKWTEVQLQDTQIALDEEVVVKEAHQKTEVDLDGVATQLKTVAKTSVADVGGLFGKLDRKTTVLSSNADAVSQHGQTVERCASQLGDKLKAFAEEHRQRSSDLQQKVIKLRESEVEALSKHSSSITKQLAKLVERTELIRAKDAIESEATSALSTQVRSTTETITTLFASWEMDLKASCESLASEVGSACSDQLDRASDAFRTAMKLIDVVVHDSQEFVSAEKDAMAQVLTLSQQATSAEIDRLRNQNTLLTQLLDSEKVKAERMRDDLIKQVSSLLVGFTDARDVSMRQAVNAVRSDIAEGQQEMATFGERVEGVAGTDAAQRFADVRKGLDGRIGEGKRAKEQGLKALSSVNTVVKDGLSTMQAGVVGAVADQSALLGEQTKVLHTTYTAALERMDRSKRARIEVTSALEVETRQGYVTLAQGLASTSKHIEQGMEAFAQESAHVAELGEGLASFGSTSVNKIRDTTRRILKEGTREDVPTGTTPRKRAFDVVDRWDLTKPREDLLREWRQERRAASMPAAETADDEEMVVAEGELDGGEDVLPGNPLSASTSTAVDEAPTPIVAPVISLQPAPPPKLPSGVGLRRTRAASGMGKPGAPREKLPLAERPTNLPSGRPSLAPASRRVR